MRDGHYLVMRYGPIIGRSNSPRRRVSVVTRERTSLDAVAYAQGWMAVERRHGGPSRLWIAKAGESGTSIKKVRRAGAQS